MYNNNINNFNNNLLNLPPIYPQNNPLTPKQYQIIQTKAFPNTYSSIAKNIKTSVSSNDYFFNKKNINPNIKQLPKGQYFYRPIRYFYQRPIQMSQNFCFPEQNKILNELQERDNLIKEFYEQSNIKYAKKSSMIEALLYKEKKKEATSSIASLSDIKRKEAELNKVMEEIFKYGPDTLKKIRLKNIQLRNVIRNIVNFNDFIIKFKEYTKRVIHLKEKKLYYIQSIKSVLNDIKLAILNKLSNSENFIKNFFINKITIETEFKKIKEDSVYIVKSFIHQLFNDLSSAFCKPSDISHNLRRLFKHYISEKSQMPLGFLTTFEFNRLEFDNQLRLNNMNINKQAMLVGFFLFCRVLIMDVFKHYLEYFDSLRFLGNPIGDVLKFDLKTNQDVRDFAVNNVLRNIQSSNNANEQMTVLKQRKMKIRNNLTYNFNFVGQVLFNIVKNAFEDIPIYEDYFKNNYIFQLLVYDKENKKHVKINGKYNDDIEMKFGMFDYDEEAEMFCKENKRWMHMYQINTVQFCKDFANLIMENKNVVNDNNNMKDNNNSLYQYPKLIDYNKSNLYNNRNFNLEENHSEINNNNINNYNNENNNNNN